MIFLSISKVSIFETCSLFVSSFLIFSKIKRFSLVNRLTSLIKFKLFWKKLKFFKIMQINENSLISIDEIFLLSLKYFWVEFKDF